MTDCSICLDQISRTNMTVCLSCGTSFCTTCVTAQRATGRTLTCAACRAPGDRLHQIGTPLPTQNTGPAPAPTTGRTCKQCSTNISINHPGSYCTSCHQNYRATYGYRRRHWTCSSSSSSSGTEFRPAGPAPQMLKIPAVSLNYNCAIFNKDDYENVGILNIICLYII